MPKRLILVVFHNLVSPEHQPAWAVRSPVSESSGHSCCGVRVSVYRLCRRVSIYRMCPQVKYCGEDHMFIMDDDLVLVYRGEEASLHSWPPFPRNTLGGVSRVIFSPCTAQYGTFFLVLHVQ